MRSTSNNAHRHTSLIPLSPVNMDPPQLARFMVSQAPRSPVVAGLVMRHRLSGRALANSPEEIVDSLSQDLSEVDQLAFSRLYTSIRTTLRQENKQRLRPLQEIVEQIDSIESLSAITQDTFSLTHQDSLETSASSLWDFDTGINVPVNAKHTAAHGNCSIIEDTTSTEATTDEESSQTSCDDFDDSISVASGAEDISFTGNTYSDPTWIPMHTKALLTLGDPQTVAGSRAMQERIARLTGTVIGAALSSPTDVGKLANQGDAGQGYADAEVQTDAVVSASTARATSVHGTRRGPLLSDYQAWGPGISAVTGSRSRIVVEISIAIN